MPTPEAFNDSVKNMFVTRCFFEIIQRLTLRPFEVVKPQLLFMCKF